MYYYVRNPSDIFFCKNLVNFNEVHLHEAILNLHTHPWCFSCLSIVSVDGKQHLSGVIFSAPVNFFILRKMTEWFGFWVVSIHPGHVGLHKQWPRLHEHLNHWWRVLGVRVRPRTRLFSLTMKIRREHWTIPHSNCPCHQLTLLTGGKKFTHGHEGSRSLHTSALRWCPPGFRIKIRSDTFLTEWCIYVYTGSPAFSITATMI